MHDEQHPAGPAPDHGHDDGHAHDHTHSHTPDHGQRHAHSHDHHSHDQHGDDHHSHDHGDEYGASHFDERAATWDDNPDHVVRAQVVADAIAAAIPLDGSTRLLDYGAGSGLFTQAIGGRVGSAVLADSSSGMRAVIQGKIDAGLIRNATVSALDLSHDAPGQARFDLIATILTLHHVADLTPVLSGFAEMLTPGGHLCIVDLDKEDGSFHPGGFGGHHGFDHDDLRRQLAEAGFDQVEFSRCHQIVRDGAEYPMFLAICAR